MSDPWYKEGLRFSCTGCGKCCTGSPGYVWITDKEVEKMAAALGISVPEFVRKYTRQVENRLSLKEMPRSYDCVFLKEGKCRVYSARPRQCRTFPFWKETIESKAAWEEERLRCEGIDHPTAPLISLNQILEALGEVEE